MADFVLSPIADKIMGALASSAVKEISMIWGVNDDLDELEKTISFIKDGLLDAEEKQLHNHQIRNLLQRLDGVVRDAYELLDEIETEALRRQVMPGNEVSKQVCTFFSSSNQLAFRHKIGQKIREIRTKLVAASQDKSFLILEARSTLDKESQVVRKRETHSFMPRDEVIGRKEETKAIIKLLIESQFEENVSVIPIVGMGGLGKTTLAQSVFDDDRVEKHFELKDWVCVSDPFDLKSIVQAITKSNSNVKLNQLQKDLRKMLGGKRDLLVLDDVWEENRGNWLELKNLLIGGAEGSRVVVTSRSKVVATITRTIEPYQLGVLDEEKSWSLFRKIAFRQGQEEKNSNFVIIGKEIIRRCGGNPLAITTIGGTLYRKHSESEWSSFNKELSKLPNGDDMLPTLRLSYDNLCPHLKHCFAYCRLFPKDYRIEVPMLIQLWMAQGLLKLSDLSHDECLEDVGYEYFVDLSERSFFQEIFMDEFGVAESCKMHDLIHDLAIEVTGEGYDNVKLDSRKVLNRNVGHVSFSCYDSNSTRHKLTSFSQARKIRTILSLEDSYSYRPNTMLKPISSDIITNFKQIRTLGLNHLGITSVPNYISKLKFVRYLDLSWTLSIKTLPDSLTTLLNLQTLKLNFCSELKELPRDMKKLINLRNLEINNCYNLKHMPVGFGELTKLTTLTTDVLRKSNGYASRHCGELKELMALNNLRGELQLCHLRHGEDATTESESVNLKEKRLLQSLYLDWDFDIDARDDDIIGYEMSLEVLQPQPNLKKLMLHCYGGVKISSWLHSLTNLVSLTLWCCENCKNLDPMSQFHNLKKLVLDDLPSLEYITNSFNDNNLSCSSLTLLTSLQKLSLRDLPNLRGWWGEYVTSEEENKHEPFPFFSHLIELSIWNCPELSDMPCYPHLEEELSLRNACLNPFQRTLLETYSFSPLSKLNSLSLKRMDDLEFLPEWLRSLTSLSYMEIIDCPMLKDLCPGILHLTALKELVIDNCKELVLDTMHSEIMWKSLNGRLKDLTLILFESMPQGIQNLTRLTALCIWRFNNMTTVPEWIGNLTSLKDLEFWMCRNLRSLPEGIRSLTSLERLKISDCPILFKRCQSKVGEDWPKIAHIPHLSIDPDEDNASGSEASQKKWNLLKSCLP